MIPSDDDLNCLLKEWTVPRSPDSLEGRLRHGYRERAASGARLTHGLQRQRGRGVWAGRIIGFLPIAGKFAGVMAGAVVLLAVITRAFPQSLYLLVPPGAIMLDSEFLEYKDDGSYTVSEYRTSSFRRLAVEGLFLDGGETTLSSSFPGDPLKTAAGNFLDPMRAILDPIAHRAIDPFFYKPRREEYLRVLGKKQTDRIRNGCTPTYWGRPLTVVGKETVLNYTATRSQYEFKDERFTEWFAPELDCFSLRSTTEKVLPAGTFRLVSERRVVKVTTNSSATAAKEPNP
jgi:hypothetical protein